MNKNSVENYINYISNIPDFLEKYLNLSILKRLKNVGYFCGMDYASKDIYDFRLTINDYVSGMRVNNLDVIGISRLRVSSDVVNYCGMLKVIFDGSTGYKFAIQTFDRNTREKIEDSGWKFDEYTFFCPSYCCFVVVVAKESDENIGYTV